MTRYFAFCSGDILLTSEGSIPAGRIPPFPIKPWNLVTTLHDGEDELQVIRMDKPITGDETLQMMGLRQSFRILSAKDYMLAGKAAELIYWDGNTKYCGVCGSPLKWMTPISKQCPECGKEWWPSPAIAIIVRIKRDDQILLVHARNFRGNHYGLVAGFVELGEDLQQTVLREVKEEVGIEINNIQYFGSQPWPYPCGLMVGFTADYVSGEVNLQACELSAGGWFKAENLPQLPDEASIARRLIDDWLAENQ